MYNTTEPLLQLAADWDFDESHDARLLELHTQIVAAIIAGEPTDELWEQYRDASDYLVDHPKRGTATQRRAGRDLVCGFICFEANDTVNGLAFLLLAQAVAHRRGWIVAEDLLKAEVLDRGTRAEILQAEALIFERAGVKDEAVSKYESALATYIKSYEDDSLINLEPARVFRYMAECYIGLVRVGDGDRIGEQEQAVQALEIAYTYAEGTPEYVRVAKLAADAIEEPWWDEAVGRLART